MYEYEYEEREENMLYFMENARNWTETRTAVTQRRDDRTNAGSA